MSVTVKQYLKPKKGTSTSVIRQGFASTTTNNNNNVDGDNISLSELKSDNANITNANIQEIQANNINTSNINVTGNAEFEGNITTHGNVTFLSSTSNSFDKVVDLTNVQTELGSHNNFDELTGSQNSNIITHNINTEYLTVTKSAHFFELVLDQIKAAGGSVLFTPADGFTVEKVDSTTLNDYFILYWRACKEVAEGEIGETLSDTGQTLTEKISVNMWQINDQAICQTFNLSNGTGSYSSLSNKYWWRVVQSVSTEPEIQEINGTKYYCHWMRVYKTGQNVDTNSDNPEVGDEVAMLGNRTNTSRQNAIYIASYNSIDRDLNAPLFAEYTGINDFNLYSHKQNWVAASSNNNVAANQFLGSFKVSTGDGNVDLDDYIKSLQDSNPFKLFVADSSGLNSPNIDNGFTLIALQTNNSDCISDINGFPQELVIALTLNDQVTPTTTIDSLYLNLNFNSNDPNQSSLSRQIDLGALVADAAGSPRVYTNIDNYDGIYVDTIFVNPTLGGPALPIIILQFNYRQGSLTGGYQNIINSSISFKGTAEDNNVTYNYGKDVPIVTVKSVNGTDGQLYLFNKIQETSTVDANKQMTTHLKYGIKYINGASITDIDPSSNMTCTLVKTLNNGTTSTSTLTYDSTNHCYVYDEIIANYYTGNVPVTYLIQFKVNNVVYDSSIVNVNLGSRSLFEVQDDMINMITTETSERTTQYGQLSVQAGQIQASVNNISNGLISTGINITQGKIDLRANKVTFTNSDGTVNDKISIDPTTGTLIAENANLSGLFKSENTESMYKVLIDSHNGGATFYSPNLLEYDQTTQTYIPASGASQQKTAEINWGISNESSSYTTIGRVNLYDAINNNKVNSISAHDIYLKNQYNGLRMNIDGINYEDFNDPDNTYYLSWPDLIGQRLSLIRTSTIDPTDITNNTLYLNVEWGFVVVNHSWNTATFNIVLPDPTICPGKVYFIKNRRNQQLRINTANNHIVDKDDNGYFILPWNADRKSCIFVSDGTDWIAFNDIS